MGDLMHELNERLAGEGAIELTNDERALIVESLRALVVAEQRVALQDRLLESFGQDREAVARLLAVEETGRFDHPVGIDLESHERARVSMRDAVERAESGAEWIGAVLDFVRVIAM